VTMSRFVEKVRGDIEMFGKLLSDHRSDPREPFLPPPSRL